jgi:hypothetical protein
MTTLIGRVPIDGTVNDPYPFKVLIGPDNLTANGIDIPDMAGAGGGQAARRLLNARQGLRRPPHAGLTGATRCACLHSPAAIPGSVC